jgi:hypothetical protein
VPGGNGVFGVSAVPNASGVFGVNDNGGNGVAGASKLGDGVQGFAHSSAKSGVFGFNDAQTPGPDGVPGGNGVFGVSAVPNASGVFGVNDNGGNGVAGASKLGDGVQGFAHSSAKSGVFGFNDAQTPGPDGVPGGNGVFGVSTVPNASGVSGAHNNGGNGLSGFSEKGTGVFGKGGKFAGFFDGNVEVAGNLTNHGRDIGAILQQMEQRIRQLEEKLVSSPPTKPEIRVSTKGVGDKSEFIVSGSGFRSNATVTIWVGDGQANQLTFQGTADSTGKLNFRQSIPCSSGSSLYFSASDGRPDRINQTGVLHSNTVTINCP